jgi:hypothetical protein
MNRLRGTKVIFLCWTSTCAFVIRGGSAETISEIYGEKYSLFYYFYYRNLFYQVNIFLLCLHFHEIRKLILNYMFILRKILKKSY